MQNDDDDHDDSHTIGCVCRAGLWSWQWAKAQNWNSKQNRPKCEITSATGSRGQTANNNGPRKLSCQLANEQISLNLREIIEKSIIVMQIRCKQLLIIAIAIDGDGGGGGGGVGDDDDDDDDGNDIEASHRPWDGRPFEQLTNSIVEWISKDDTFIIN